ncbi:MAG: hypothetical protein AB8D52_04890 [Gammaproteobacteria bacterium]
MYSEQALEKSSKLRSTVILIIGALILAIGIFWLKPTWQVFQTVLSEFNTLNSPYTYASLIYQGLWLLVAVCTVIAGLSLMMSAIRRKQFDLIPGPTLYFLGLALSVIAGFILMSGLSWQAMAILIIGLFLIYWEWAYHVS